MVERNLKNNKLNHTKYVRRKNVKSTPKKYLYSKLIGERNFQRIIQVLLFFSTTDEPKKSHLFLSAQFTLKNVKQKLPHDHLAQITGSSPGTPPGFSTRPCGVGLGGRAALRPVGCSPRRPPGPPEAGGPGSGRGLARTGGRPTPAGGRPGPRSSRASVSPRIAAAGGRRGEAGEGRARGKDEGTGCGGRRRGGEG